MAETVSVILPAYNAARFVRQAVESVHQQSQADLQIIVVDDGSSDDTLTIAQSLTDVVVIHQENKGPAAARNAGLRMCDGHWVAFLDADDLWMPGKLALQLDCFRRDPSWNLVAGLVEEFLEQPAHRIECRPVQPSRAYTAGALLVRRADLLNVGYFNEQLRFGEFMDWHSRALACGMKEWIIDRVVLQRRIHDRNTTRVAANYQSHYLAMVKAHLQRKHTSQADRQEHGP